jgi:ABC-2 type transport system permease protein
LLWQDILDWQNEPDRDTCGSIFPYPVLILLIPSILSKKLRAPSVSSAFFVLKSAGLRASVLILDRERMMEAYLGFAKRGFQRAISYRFQFWTELVINILFMYVYLCVWRALYQHQGAVGGYDRAGLLTYIVVSQTMFTLQFGVRAWAMIEAKVRTGEVVVDLVRPVDFQGMMLATGVGAAVHILLTNMVPKFALFCVAGVVQPPSSALGLGLFPISVALGFLVVFGVEFLIGISAFWLVEIRGLYSIVMWGAAAFFSGYFLPIEFFPSWLKAVARVLPFPSMVYTPSAIYVGSLAGPAAVMAVLGQLAWAVALVGVGRLLFARAHRRLVVQGG